MRGVTENIAAALPRAAAVFATRGLDGTRMNDIVAATGIPRPTLYYHCAAPRFLVHLSCEPWLE